MTTRFEAELQEIEAKLRNPSKASQITASLREHVKIQRERERARDERTKALGREIVCVWVTGEPKRWEEATAQIELGGRTNAVTITPYKKVDGEMKLDPKLVRLGYDGFVEDWAMWKWHQARGSEVNDNDQFILDCEAPEFVWQEAIEATPKPKRGRPAKVVA